ncbi:FtsX-like permease family protein [Actinotalea sp. JY-7876]|uniref:FtsX-like permease family protein n=2 Tax=unclassified Actinotalea TaxID=2638618 RepID=UPI0015F37F2D|nr:FtsX-like permease family protein [Actinotalea sp. JY-7876]
MQEPRASARARPARPRVPWGWLAATVLRRARAQWRVLAVVGLVALLVTTSLGTLTLLVTRSEGEAVRAALATTPASELEVRVVAQDVEGGTAAAQERAALAVSAAIGVPVTARALDAESGLAEVPREGRRSALTWVAVRQGVEDHAVLVDGRWPDPAATGAVLEVAVPEAGAAALGVVTGDTIPLVDPREGEPAVGALVVGLFRAGDLDDPWWQQDRLRGVGHDPVFPVPFAGGTVVTDGVGPLVVAQAGFDASPLTVAELTVHYTPDVDGVGPGDLARLGVDRETARDGVADALRGTVSGVRYSSDLETVAGRAAGALVVTRSGVVVVALLLVVVAVATLTQSARLLAEDRRTEHELMRARGSSRAQLVAAGALESFALGGGAAVAGTLLATRVHAALVQGTTLAGTAGADVGLLPWLVAAGAALLVTAVGVTPLLGPGDTFVESEQARARPERQAALARAGLDVVLVVLGGVALWQLQTYGSPVRRSDGGVAIDPVLVVGPAVVLTAATLLALRLLPAASALLERLAARGRGIVPQLAGWEIGRRSGRAATAVLLVAVTVAVATFTRSYLSTWSTSQAEQAAFSVGAPVVVESAASQTPAVLAEGARAVGGGEPQPALVASARLRQPTQAGTGARTGHPVAVLAATASARQHLAEGRVGREGGAAVAALPGAAPSGEGIVLPDDAVGLAGTIDLSAGDPPPGVVLASRLLLEDAAGLVSAVRLPLAFSGEAAGFAVLLDGVRAPAATIAATATEADWQGGAHRTPLRVVGLEVQLVVGAPELLASSGGYRTTVEVRDLAAVVAGVGPVSATEPGPAANPLPWPSAHAVPLAGLAAPLPAEPGPTSAVVEELPAPAAGTRAWPGVVVAGDLRDLRQTGARAAATTWPEAAARPGAVVVPAVISESAAARWGSGPGGRLVLGVGDVSVDLVVTDVVPRVPTSRSGDQVAVDHTSLVRRLAVLGREDLDPTHWWVDVPAAQVDHYLAGLPDDAAGVPLGESGRSVAGLTRDLREGPLHVTLPLALRLVTLAAALVALLGYAVHTTMTLRSRDVELAQLRAVGLQRSRLVGVVTVEALVVCGLGGVVGVAVGLLVARVVGPLVAVAPDGSAPVPSVVVDVPWGDVGLVLALVAAAAAVTAVGAATRQRTADPGAILRSASR